MRRATARGVEEVEEEEVEEEEVEEEEGAVFGSPRRTSFVVRFSLQFHSCQPPLRNTAVTASPPSGGKRKTETRCAVTAGVPPPLLPSFL